MRIEDIRIFISYSILPHNRNILKHKRASEYNSQWDYPVDMDIWLEAGLRVAS